MLARSPVRKENPDGRGKKNDMGLLADGRQKNHSNARLSVGSICLIKDYQGNSTCQKPEALRSSSREQHRIGGNHTTNGGTRGPQNRR